VGLYWYHAHVNRLAESQVHGGMSGMILMGNILQNFTELRNIKEVVWQVKDLQLEGPDDQGLYHVAPSPLDEKEDTIRSVNGEVHPTFEIEENELQFWTFANMGPNIYYNLSFSGFPMFELVRDGHVLNKLIRHTHYLFGAGARVGFLIVGPPAGTYEFSTLAFNTGPGGDDFPHVDLARVISKESNRPIPSLPSTGFPDLQDLRNFPIAHERKLEFTQDEEENFFINGKQYDPNRIDFQVKLGTFEKWTLLNSADEDHFFHIHQLSFQVVEFAGDEADFVGYQDTVQLPFLNSTVIILPFTNPVIVGKFVVHCHLLGHEDHGMMATVVVTP